MTRPEAMAWLAYMAWLGRICPGCRHSVYIPRLGMWIGDRF